MKDFDRLRVRFRQFGGWRLVWAYAKLGLFFPILYQTLKCIVMRRSFKRVYPTILRRVEPMLVRKYLTTTSTISTNPTSSTSSADRRRIWWCWLQGFESAPPLAKACLRSLRRLDAEIVVLDDTNYAEWVQLPPHVVARYKAGRMPAALFSDILRLALLIRHGGVWVDSTVFCTGAEATKYSPSWDEICASPLYIFQYTRPGARHISIGNWFISAAPGNALLADLYQALCRYWHDNDVTLDYYIFHLFFAHLAQRHPALTAAMPYGYATAAIQMGQCLGYRFDAVRFTRLTHLSAWHKMSPRVKPALLADPDNVYHHILQQ